MVESLHQGLDVGSAVKFRGVPIGSVSRIAIGPDQRHVEVTSEIDAAVHRHFEFERRQGMWVINDEGADLEVPVASPLVNTPEIWHLENGGAGEFHRSIHAGGNPDRVCGSSPIFLTAALAGGPGTLLHYGQAVAADGSQVVSFCSMSF